MEKCLFVYTRNVLTILSLFTVQTQVKVQTSNISSTAATVAGMQSSSLSPIPDTKSAIASG